MELEADMRTMVSPIAKTLGRDFIKRSIQAQWTTLKKLELWLKRRTLEKVLWLTKKQSYHELILMNILLMRLKNL